MSPSRSVNGTIDNQTGNDLTLEAAWLDHGEWTLNYKPPQIIKSGTSGSFQAESDGVMTGVQGTVKYTGPAGEWVFNFNNPYDGSNSYSYSSPPGYPVQQSGGSGDNADVTWACNKSN